MHDRASRGYRESSGRDRKDNLAVGRFDAYLQPSRGRSGLDHLEGVILGRGVLDRVCTAASSVSSSRFSALKASDGGVARMTVGVRWSSTLTKPSTASESRCRTRSFWRPPPFGHRSGCCRSLFDHCEVRFRLCLGEAICWSRSRTGALGWRVESGMDVLLKPCWLILCHWIAVSANLIEHT